MTLSRSLLCAAFCLILAGCDAIPEIPDLPDDPIDALIGEMVVELEWDSSADLDLIVTVPSGVEITFTNPSSGDAQHSGDETSGPASESVTWSGTIPTGSYTVTVRQYSGGSAVPYRLRVEAPGYRQSFSGSAAPGTPVTAATLSVGSTGSVTGSGTGAGSGGTGGGGTGTGTGGGTGGTGGGSSGAFPCPSTTPRAGYQCLDSGTGQLAPSRYNLPALHGTWFDASAEVCVTWRADGTATVAYEGGNTASGRWGVLLSNAGALLPNADNWYVATVGSSGIDPQIRLLTFNVASSTFVNWGFRRQTCPY